MNYDKAGWTFEIVFCLTRRHGGLNQQLTTNNCFWGMHTDVLPFRQIWIHIEPRKGTKKHKTGCRLCERSVSSQERRHGTLHVPPAVGRSPRGEFRFRSKLLPLKSLWTWVTAGVCIREGLYGMRHLDGRCWFELRTLRFVAITKDYTRTQRLPFRWLPHVIPYGSHNIVALLGIYYSNPPRSAPLRFQVTLCNFAQYRVLCR